jgi:tetratricopeptide (TPR) repeat protein
MVSVFLSYDRDDVARARPIATALKDAGYSVWWDAQISGGSQFSKEIEQALASADVVVVLWTSSSVDSPWVRDEAIAGRDRDRLVPLSVDGTLPPLGFRQFQSIDLGAWRGRGKLPRLKEILAAVDRQAGASAPGPASPPRVSRGHQWQALNMWMVGAVSTAILLVAAGLLIGRPWEVKSNSVPIIAVGAADSSPHSQQIARDLLIGLGSLQLAKSGSMTLVSGSSTPETDLLFQASDTSDGGTPSATLSLLNGKDQGLLWSADLKQPSGNASDLEEQLAFTAGAVLGCALDGFSERKHPLNPQTFKTYLSACAQLSDVASSDPGTAVPLLHQVTADTPRFAPAWGKLLIAEAASADVSATNGVPDEDARRELREHIDSARTLIPAIPEADLAETVLLPPTAYARKLELINRAAQHGRDNPVVLSFRAEALQSVGRMGDAIGDAARAAEIDPLSPRFLQGYMAALAFAGYFDAARDELEQLERRWPGSATARSARYTFNFHYGDPKIALAMEETQSGTAGVRYLLEARIDPSRANVERLVEFLRGRKDRFRENAGANRLSYYLLAMAMFHQHDELFDTLVHWFKPSDLAVIAQDYFRPELHEFRKEPRFFVIMKGAGLVDYWRTSGKWPDFCFETDMPYDCKKVAASLE